MQPRIKKRRREGGAAWVQQHQVAAASALALPSAMALSLALIIVTSSARVQCAFALGAEKTPALDISTLCPSDAKVSPGGVRRCG